MMKITTQKKSVLRNKIKYNNEFKFKKLKINCIKIKA